MRILLAEDELRIAEHLKAGLRAEGFSVDVAHDGDEALWMAQENPYDVLLMDVMLPGRDGLTVVRQLRRKGLAAPVIFLTARGDVEDKVRGLDAGGDDYIVKPFFLIELLARLRAIMRRQRSSVNNVLRVEDLELDLLSRCARRAGVEVELTPREFALLEFLVSASPKTVSRTAIVEHVWDQHFDSGTNVVNVYVNRLRRKIDLPGQLPLVQTVRGVGFAIRKDGA